MFNSRIFVAPSGSYAMTDTLNVFALTNPYAVAVDSPYPDTLSAKGQEALITGRFVQDGPMALMTEVHRVPSSDLYVYAVLAFMILMAVLWRYLPERFHYAFNLGERVAFFRGGSGQSLAPGIILDSFFLLNFLFTISLLTYIMALKYFSLIPSHLVDYRLFGIIVAAYALFWVYRRMVMGISALIFETGEQTREQMRLDRNVENVTGVILLPLLLVVSTNPVGWLLIIMLLTALSLQVFRWFQSARIGISNTGFTAFHFILYLCALEIVPVLVAVKVLLPGFFM